MALSVKFHLIHDYQMMDREDLKPYFDSHELFILICIKYPKEIEKFATDVFYCTYYGLPKDQRFPSKSKTLPRL